LLGKFVAFTGVAAAAVVCFAHGDIWRAVAAQAADRPSALALAGGLFTIAIAVLIRD
jgi:hypothetical protein